MGNAKLVNKTIINEIPSYPKVNQIPANFNHSASIILTVLPSIAYPLIKQMVQLKVPNVEAKASQLAVLPFPKN